MQHAVHRPFRLKGLAYIPAPKLKRRIALQMLEIASVSSHEIIETDNVMSFGDETVTEVRADEPRGPRHNESQTFSPQCIYRSVGHLPL